MDKKNYKKEFVKMNEEQVRNATQSLRNEKYNLDNLNIAIETLKKRVELEMSKRGEIIQLEEYNKQKERIEKNIKAFEKQVRDKQFINYVPKEQKTT